jgi:hypothetical protein
MKIRTVELEDGDFIAGGYGSGITVYIKDDKDNLYWTNVHRSQINPNNPVVEVTFCGHASHPHYSVLKWDEYRIKKVKPSPDP